jgi:N-methylhydantoinase A
MVFRIGVDVGGTFTDVLLIGNAQLHRAKVPSTPQDPSLGVLEGIRKVCESAGVQPDDIATILHSTTIATNAVLEGKGARVGLLTTQGFKQILHLARSQTPGPLAGWIIMIKPDPPAALEDTEEVEERIGAKGEIVTPLNERQAKAAIESLLQRGIESLTVSLINSFANPTHEQRLQQMAQEMAPEIPVTISSEILPEYREYERTVTACMNAYVRPRVGRYIEHLEDNLKELGFRGQLNILRSDGGLMTAQTVERFPVQAILSGPAGGVIGALFIARKAGYNDILTLDMGGTSTDVALCEQGQPTRVRETELGYFRVKVPSVNVHSIGAGGGSIAHVPEITGALRVGPESAGAEPGPACYGKGGEAPTVTDANVVLGHLPPQLVGGAIHLDVEAAREAIQRIARQLDLPLERAAQGILDIVNENMAGALRVVSVQRGYDPRGFALLAFGGAGPMHANAVAEIMGCFPVLIPPSPGLLCALGDLVADFRTEQARTYIRKVNETSAQEILEILEELGRQAQTWLRQEGIPSESSFVRYSVDVRYYRQGYEITVELSPEEIAGRGVQLLADRFHVLHKQLYGFTLDRVPCEIVTLRAIGIGQLPEPHLPETELDDSDATHALEDEHEVFFKDSWVPTRVYDRAKLRPGNRLPGPAIVTEFDSTTVVLPGYLAEVDRHFNLVIRRSEEAT